MNKSKSLDINQETADEHIYFSREIYPVMKDVKKTPNQNTQPLERECLVLKAVICAEDYV